MKITNIIEALRDDKPVIIPTDTIYGFSALSSSPTAFEKVEDLKKRDGKPFILLDSDFDRVKSYFSDEIISSKILDRLKEEIWPNGLTLIGKRSVNYPFHFLREIETIAVRYTDHHIIKEITETLGEGILSTSVNISGSEELYQYDEIKQFWEDKVPYILNGDTGNYRSSAIISFMDGELKLLREGPEKIMTKLEKIING